MPRRASQRHPTLERLEGRSLLATLSVTNTLDAGAGSFRQAIIDADAASGPSTIDFAIPGSGVQTIRLASRLPSISRAVTIDGTSQPGSAGGPLIRIDGSGIPYTPGGIGNPPPSGLRFGIGADGSVVEGLIITGFAAEGIFDDGPSIRVIGNDIGVTPDGAAGAGNKFAGILIALANPATATGTTITGNVIGGNYNGIELDGASNVTIAGNFIGTDRAGALVLGNLRDGIFADASTTGSAASGNTISNNGYAGIEDLSNGGLAASSNATANNGANIARLAVTASTTSVATSIGRAISVTYTITNTGPATATDARVDFVARSVRTNTDASTPLAASTVFRFTGATASQGTTASGDPVSSYAALLGTLATGASATVTVAASIIGPGSDAIDATAASDNPQPPTLAPQASTTIVATGTADLVVASSASPVAATVGRPETFTFTVTNRGTAAADARFALFAGAPAFYPGIGSLPGTAQSGVLVSQGTVAAGNPALGGRPYTGDLGMLAAGASATVTVVIIPPVGGVVSASLYADSANLVDATPADNFAFAAAQAAPPAIAPPAATAPILVGAQAIYASAGGPIVGVQIDFQGALDPATARQLANYSLTTTGSSRAIRLKSASYAAPSYAGISVVTIRTALPQPRSGAALQLVVDGPGSPGIRGQGSSARVPISTRTVPR